MAVWPGGSIAMAHISWAACRALSEVSASFGESHAATVEHFGSCRRVARHRRLRSVGDVSDGQPCKAARLRALLAVEENSDELHNDEPYKITVIRCRSEDA
jgi:hypothetical protein